MLCAVTHECNRCIVAAVLITTRASARSSLGPHLHAFSLRTRGSTRAQRIPSQCFDCGGCRRPCCSGDMRGAAKWLGRRNLWAEIYRRGFT